MTHLMILFSCFAQHCVRIDSYEVPQCDTYWARPLDTAGLPQRAVFTVLCADLPEVEIAQRNRTLNGDMHR